VLDSDGGGDRLTIVAETEPGGDAEVATRLRRAVHDLLSLTPEIQLCPAGTIERAPGKSVRVVDRRART
jgi:phenylacetate-coenzyme A ligase PaaK-like adenylate-forming protein